MSSSDSGARIRGLLRIFGYDPTEVRLKVIPRSTRWRGVRAAAWILGGTLVGVPLAVLPPHALWPLAGLGGGGFMAWRKWSERYTLEELEGRCPRCDHEIVESGPTRLRISGSVDCPNCNNSSTLDLSETDLPTP